MTPGDRVVTYSELFERLETVAFELKRCGKGNCSCHCDMWEELEEILWLLGYLG